MENCNSCWNCEVLKNLSAEAGLSGAATRATADTVKDLLAASPKTAMKLKK
jgi:hypothetical protein